MKGGTSAWLSAAVIVLASSEARGDDKQQCLAASDQGQQLRDDGKYQAAREAFGRCSRDACPAPVRRDCLRWLSDLEVATPTIVISAKDDKGGDLVDVKVLLDGAPLTSKLDGKPAPVDPGEHVFHGEAPGFPPVDDHVVVHAGEKSRMVTMQFGAPAPSPGTGVAPGAGGSTPETPSASHGGPPVVAWVLAGLAVAAFGSEAYFGLTALDQRSGDLGPSGCAPNCSDSEKSSIQTKFLVADISLGVGVVSAVLATYFVLSSHGSTAASQSARVDFAGYHF